MDAVTTHTDRASFRAVARSAAPGTRVPVEVHLRADPFDAYRRARGGDPSVFYETGGGRDGWGYFGVTPDRFVAVGADGSGASGEQGTLARLAALTGDERLARGDCPVPFPGGWFGWLSYDVARELESLPGGAVDDRGLPRLQAARYDCVAAWECPPVSAGDTLLRVTAAPRIEGGDEAAVDAAYDRGRERALALARAATDGDPAVGAPPVTAGTVTFESDCGRAAYADRVRQVQASVRDGETFQANISHRLSAPAAVHPVAVFDALRRTNPAPYSGLVEFPGVDLVSASPELLVERDGDALVTEPIAGTRPRGETPAADERLAADLRSDEKERAEHAMLVDLERNDLGKVCAYGSVTVDEYRRVDRYSEVMHLVSRVSGTRRPGCDIADLVAAVFPGGTITGAPKPRTMAIIDELETRRRGPYTGSMFALGFDGRTVLNILIRTLVRHGDEYHLRVGGGVVHDSVPDREYEETLDKARALVTAVDVAVGDRTDLGVEQ